jgi:hypothetical protein
LKKSRALLTPIQIGSLSRSDRRKLTYKSSLKQKTVKTCKPLRIGILTFHEVYNPGAFLQAFATQQLIRHLGHKPEIINYNTSSFRYSPFSYLWSIKRNFHRLWRIFLDRTQKDFAFRCTRKFHFNESRFISKASDFENIHWDVVLVGADIVWNYSLRNDPVYFGNGIRTNNLIAFAPSAGNCDWRSGTPDYVREGLLKFCHLSARDENTKQMAETLTGRSCSLICDPAYHISETYYKDEVGSGEFILVYVMPEVASEAFINEIKRLRRDSGLPVYAIYYRHVWADRNIMFCSPFTWMNAIRKAKYVLTNTFHGTVFSILTGASFILEYNDANRNKTIGVIKGCDLENRVYNSDQNKGFKGLFECLNREAIKRFIESERAISKDFLSDSLDRL